MKVCLRVQAPDIHTQRIENENTIIKIIYNVVLQSKFEMTICEQSRACVLVLIL